MSRTPDLTLGIHALLEAGLPDGPLARPSRFYAAESGTKLHSDYSCGRLRNGASLRAYDFRTADVADFCTSCAKGPTDADQLAYIEAAHTLTGIRNRLARLRADIIGDQLGRPLSTDSVSDEPHYARARSLTEPLEVHATTWHRVTCAHVLVEALDEILAHPLVHPDMVEYMTDVELSARTLLAQLRKAAGGVDPTISLLSSCVLDLMSTFAGHVGRTPADGRPKLRSADAYPALVRLPWGTEAGVDNVILDAWRTWREHVRATGDFAGARAEVDRSTRVDSLEPSEINQLHRGAARTAAPASGSLWDWQVAEWRLDAHESLGRLCTEWEEVFTELLNESLSSDWHIVSVRGKHSSADREPNASKQLLIRLDTHYDAGRQVTLVLAPLAAARWLKLFGTTGKASLVNDGRTSSVTLMDAVPANIDAAVLRTALSLWDEPAYAASPTPKYMPSLASAVSTATAVLA